nr:glycosyltransferase family 4 protein [uncultured Brevundimonas sp.]
MRVLLINTLYPPDSEGGAEQSVAQLARGLADAGAEAAVLSLKPGGALSMARADGVTLWRAPMRNLYWPYDGGRRPALLRLGWHGVEAIGRTMDDIVLEVVRQERPRLIHAQVTTGFGTSVARAAAEAGVPLVQTVRDYSLMCARAAMFRKGRRCERRCADCILLTAGKKRASEQAAAWVSVSSSLAKAHQGQGYFGGASGRVIGNAAARVKPSPRPGFDQAAELTFGFIGRVEPEKGVEVLLKAMLQLGDGWRLRIAGRGDAAYVEGLKRRFDDPRIDWLGQMAADDFYGSVDVVMAPALWAEPFGRTAAEAVAHGRGLIASRIGGLPEAAGDAPFVMLVEPGDVDGLTATMQRALDARDDWRFGALANSRAAPPWDEAAVAEAHLALYREVLTRASRTAAEASQL